MITSDKETQALRWLHYLHVLYSSLYLLVSDALEAHLPAEGTVGGHLEPARQARRAEVIAAAVGQLWLAQDAGADGTRERRVGLANQHAAETCKRLGRGSSREEWIRRSRRGTRGLQRNTVGHFGAENVAPRVELPNWRETTRAHVIYVAMKTAKQ